MSHAAPRPPTRYRLCVEGFDREIGDFTACSAIEPRVEALGWAGGGPSATRAAPARTGWADVTLARVYAGHDELSQWWDEARNGIIRRRTVSITVLAPDGVTPIQRHDLLSAVPVAWALPELDAPASDPAIERIALAFEHAITTP